MMVVVHLPVLTPQPQVSRLMATERKQWRLMRTPKERVTTAQALVPL